MPQARSLGKASARTGRPSEASSRVVQACAQVTPDGPVRSHANAGRPCAFAFAEPVPEASLSPRRSSLGPSTASAS